MTEHTARFALPLLAAGQAQKEVLHNEAIVALERLAQPIVDAAGGNEPPAAPADGACWIVGPQPIGAWVGHPSALASWTAGGWRFTEPVEGMDAYDRATGRAMRRRAGAWVSGRPVVDALLVGADQVVGSRQPAIGDPAGGAAIDGEARGAIGQILAALRAHGLIAT